MPMVILVCLAVIAFFYCVNLYNALIRLRNLCKNSFSQIDIQLLRRYDLIPNLVETAKGYMKHERETLEAVIKARNEAFSVAQTVSEKGINPQLMKQLMGAEGALGQIMGKFMALSENYPELKANQNMLQVMEELTTTENKISFARQSYNDSVMEYNNQREVFPSSIIANMFHFQEMILFEVTNFQAKESVKVNFN